MNTIDFNKNDFPLTTNVLGYMQAAVQLIDKFAGIIAGNYIISGGETVGSSIMPGYVVAGGEIMHFAGGVYQPYVRIITTNETITVGDGTYTKTTKQLVLGSGSGQIAWSSFKRASDLIENRTFSLPSLTGSAGLARTIVDIGSWNMDATASKTVILPVLNDKVRSIKVLIRWDSPVYSSHRDLMQAGSFSAVNANEILLERNASGVFDNNAYDDTSINRGWILIDHIL
jgi:hypothetical protein